MGCADSKEKTAAPTIKAGEQLNKGQSIVSANGRFKFIVQEDGNAVIYRGERALWATHTDKKTVTHITLLADGVLILKNAEETVWATETKDSGADKLTIQDDGNLVLLDKDGQVKWESKSTFDDGQYDLRTKSAVVAAKAPIGVHVEAGKTYYWCTCGKSKNQPFCDGSHQGSDFKPLAWTAPEAKEVYFCLCKQTKNAPFCDGAHASLPDESQYDLRTKSAVVALRRPLKVSLEAGKTYYWCTCGKSKNQPWCDGSHQGTEFKPLAWTAPESKEAFICACKQTKNAPFCDGAHRELPPTDTLHRSTTDYLIAGGAGIKSKNGKYRVLLQTDGNVVLYEGDVDAPEHAKWATATDGKGGFKFIIQNDGNVVLYNKEDHPLWASNTDGSAATRLVVTDDGKLVLFGEGDHHIWSS